MISGRKSRSAGPDQAHDLTLGRRAGNQRSRVAPADETRVFAVRVYRPGWEGDPDETVAAAGPFHGVGEAAEALVEAGWQRLDAEDDPGERRWESRQNRALRVEVIPLVGTVPQA